MPSINLRLTDEEHEQLSRWAHDGYRSLQKEIIFRIFDGRLMERGGARKEEVGVPEPPAESQRRDTDAGRIGLAARSLDVPRSTSRPDSHFKPDFKK